MLYILSIGTLAYFFGVTVCKDCSNVVSYDKNLSTKDCQEKCWQGETPSECREETFSTMNGHIVPQGSCFGNWAFGYVDEAIPTSTYAQIGVWVGRTNGTAQCQMKCQESADCVYFQWRGIASGAGGEYASVGSCLLKSKEIVVKANSQYVFDIKSKTDLPIDFTYCNSQMSYACSNLYTCCKKNEKFACVFKQYYLVGGPKHCAEPMNEICSTAPNNNPSDPSNAAADGDSAATTGVAIGGACAGAAVLGAGSFMAMKYLTNSGGNSNLDGNFEGDAGEGAETTEQTVDVEEGMYG